MPREKREVPIEQCTAMTLAEVGRALGITPQGVQFIQDRALAKIALEIIRIRREKAGRPA